MVTGGRIVLSPADLCTDTTLRSDIDPNTSKTLVSCRCSNNNVALFIASYTTKPSIQGGAHNDDLRRLRNGWVRGAGRRTRQSSDVAAQSMVRLMAAVESRPPIPTVGEVPEPGTVPTAAGAEAARQTLSAPAPPVVAVTNPSPSHPSQSRHAHGHQTWEFPRRPRPPPCPETLDPRRLHIRQLPVPAPVPALPRRWRRPRPRLGSRTRSCRPAAALDSRTDTAFHLEKRSGHSSTLCKRRHPRTVR